MQHHDSTVHHYQNWHARIVDSGEDELQVIERATQKNRCRLKKASPAFYPQHSYEIAQMLDNPALELLDIVAPQNTSITWILDESLLTGLQPILTKRLGCRQEESRVTENGINAVFSWLPKARATWRETAIQKASKQYQQMSRQQALAFGFQSEQLQQLPMFYEATELVEAGEDRFGRIQRLSPRTADAWFRLCKAAQDDGIALELISGYRGWRYQQRLLDTKKSKGLSLPEICAVNAPCGYSEHHTGRALDIGAPGAPALETRFEETRQFEWLCANADEYGFVMSYPRENPYGFIYEPWHWCFQP